MTVNLLEDTTSINDISQLDYIDFLSSHRPDFSLLSFSHTENHIYGEATYLNNGILTSLIQYYYANCVYHYIITYECPTDYGEYMVPLFREAIDSVKIFYASEPVPDTTLSLSENNSNDLQADSFDSYKARIQENHQLMETNENTEASSFAEALMIVCNKPIPAL